MHITNCENLFFLLGVCNVEIKPPEKPSLSAFSEILMHLIIYFYISESHFPLGFQSPDDLSFKASTILNVIKFSKQQWDEYALIIGFSLQDIADCQLTLSTSCNYQNTLLQKWLATDNTASWYKVMTAVKAMLPPACDYADSIIQQYPKLAKITEKELKYIEEIMTYGVVPTYLKQIPIISDQCEEMDVDGAIENVCSAADVRYNDIKNVLRASNKELEELSNSEEYWKRQNELDTKLIDALKHENSMMESLLSLCEDLSRDWSKSEELQSQIQKQWEEIESMDIKVQLKNSVFEELHEQSIRLERLMSKNAERLANICGIPSKVSNLKEDADKNQQLGTDAKNKLQFTIQRQMVLLRKFSQSDEIVRRIDEEMKIFLKRWESFFAIGIGTAALGLGLVGLSVAFTAATAGGGLPVALSVGTGLGLGGVGTGLGGVGAVLGLGGAAVAAYSWKVYKNDGRRNADLIHAEVEERSTKRIRLNDMHTKMNSLIERHEIESY